MMEIIEALRVAWKALEAAKKDGDPVRLNRARMELRALLVATEPRDRVWS